MSFPVARLEIQVHLETGRISRFLQTEAEAIEAFLTHVQPGKFFSNPVLMLGESGSLTAFPMSRVVRIDLISDSLLEWPLPFEINGIRQIAADEFERRVSEEITADASNITGPTIAITPPLLAELELVDGERLFATIDSANRADQPLPLEIAQRVRHFFTQAGLFMKSIEGGLVMVNPAMLVRCSFYGGLPQLPPGAYYAERIGL